MGASPTKKRQRAEKAAAQAAKAGRAHFDPVVGGMYAGRSGAGAGAGAGAGGSAAEREAAAADATELTVEAIWARLGREPRVALVGRPNVGKSTLFNLLCGHKATHTSSRWARGAAGRRAAGTGGGATPAIVSRVPGTTRDWKEGRASIGGMPFRLVDTAGLEAEGEGAAVAGVGLPPEQRHHRGVDAAGLLAAGEALATSSAMHASTPEEAAAAAWGRVLTAGGFVVDGAGGPASAAPAPKPDPGVSVAQRMAEQTAAAVRSADAVWVVLDARQGVTADDERLAEWLRGVLGPAASSASGRVMVVLNKSDGVADVAGWDEWWAVASAEAAGLGVGGGACAAVSAAQGQGTAELLDHLAVAVAEAGERGSGPPNRAEDGPGGAGAAQPAGGAGDRVSDMVVARRDRDGTGASGDSGGSDGEEASSFGGLGARGAWSEDEGGSDGSDVPPAPWTDSEGASEGEGRWTPEEDEEDEARAGAGGGAAAAAPHGATQSRASAGRVATELPGRSDEGASSLGAEAPAPLTARERLNARRAYLAEHGEVAVAVVGRPNVGKSTLVNRLLGQERLLTGPTAGLTRDATEVEMECEGRRVALLDTAGMRRAAKWDWSAAGEGLEAASAAAARAALGRAGVVVLVVDATEGLTRQDAAIAQTVTREGRALVVVANKLDGVPDRAAALSAVAKQADHAAGEARGAAVVGTSALAGLGTGAVLPAVLEAHARWSRRIRTSQLNAWLQRMLAAHPPPSGTRRGSARPHEFKGRPTTRVAPLRVLYASQVHSRPPTFSLFTNKSEVPRAWGRFLLSSLREEFDLWGVPLRLRVRGGAKAERAAPRGSSSGAAGKPAAAAVTTTKRAKPAAPATGAARPRQAARGGGSGNVPRARSGPRDARR
ncbi:hypothetical protein FNF27_07022 [Cafeteria roenbergensis]|uniref:GTPase Der n=2 Tax=Cafeteria roenbergensis TaxID=33653 RepID=A0A5A8CW09_CAFRO|nr:hypothetical protein FNF29_07455 [Cafeteria roenbergensis]KAA0157343.1 hypothetical protein FNF31_05768 [Cafeteria roenbergensis]KAA0163538.1 hypothetical protein FNF28_04195 [Cafeteria roenbergensis]KAA0169203.1 hypothetical protein FNF27_07022 [Cafeteria roenbergensis]|eukprot:KAA0147286.1 hypothetical protein FNF29_07455 [Cafeteria roenbergensis]